MKWSLEDRLAAFRGPAMPQDVEERLRKRITAEAGKRQHPVARGAGTASAVKWLILAVLLLTAAWVVRKNVMPVLRAAWERAHCLVEPAKGKQ